MDFTDFSPFFNILFRKNKSEYKRKCNERLLLELQNDCKHLGKRGIESKIYAYFLFFSGILLIIKDQNDYLLQLKLFFFERN